jgi:hypothetical protein
MAVLHRLLLLIIWGFVALITLMIYGTSVSADEHLPTAGEILQNGKTLHKEVHLLRDINRREPVLNITHEYKTEIGRIIYHVMYKEEYYLCYAHNDKGYFNLSEIGCLKLLQDPTYALE